MHGIQHETLFTCLFHMKSRTDIYCAIFRWLLIYSLIAILLLFVNRNLYSEENLKSKNLLPSKTQEIFQKTETKIRFFSKLSRFRLKIHSAADSEWIICPSGSKPAQDPTVFGIKASYYHPIERRVVLSGLSDAAQLLNQGNFPFSYTCVFFDKKQYFLAETHGEFYTSYLFYCGNRTDSVVPKYVHLYRNDSIPDFAATASIPVLKIENLAARKNEPLHGDLAICSGPFFGHQNWLLLLQFFEYYQLQGVSKIFVTKKSDFSEFTGKLLDAYRRQNFVEILNWESDFKFCGKDGDPYCSQLAQKNDCILKNVFRYRYVLLCDFDELLQPVNKSVTLLQLLQTKDNDPKIGAFTFGARYHVTKTILRSIPSNVTSLLDNKSRFLRENLPFLTWNNVSGPVNMAYSPKTVVKPVAIQKMWVHFVREFYGKHKPLDIDQKTEGFFHHFKNVTVWPQFVETEYAKYANVKPVTFFDEEFVVKLTANIRKTLKSIFESDKME